MTIAKKTTTLGLAITGVAAAALLAVGGIAPAIAASGTTTGAGSHVSANGSYDWPIHGW